MTKIRCNLPGELILVVTTVLMNPAFCQRHSRQVGWFPPGQLSGELLEAIINREPTQEESAGWAEEDGEEYEAWVDKAIVEWANGQDYPCLIEFHAVKREKFNWDWEVFVSPLSSIPTLTEFLFNLSHPGVPADPGVPSFLE